METKQFSHEQSLRLVEKAFREVDRSNFVPPEYQEFANLDQALPIGYGQTISQPTTVRFMLQWLDIKPGQTILDVGSGSGWSSALLAHVVGPTGRIYAVDILPQLVEMGRRNCEKIGLHTVAFSLPDHAGGLAKYAPYDRILVSASAKNIPKSLLRQLKISGKIVIPVKDAILESTKTVSRLQTITHPGFVFVPYITEK